MSNVLDEAMRQIAPGWNVLAPDRTRLYHAVTLHMCHDPVAVPVTVSYRRTRMCHRLSSSPVAGTPDVTCTGTRERSSTPGSPTGREESQNSATSENTWQGVESKVK
jgi:hypothetical protein